MAVPTWVGPAIQAGTQIAGQVAAARAQGRASDSVLQQGQDRTNLDAYSIDAATKARLLEALDRSLLERASGQLTQEQAALKAPQSRADNAVRGDILANVQDVTVSHPRANVVNFGGGIRPSMLSGDTRALGKAMSREALLSQMKGSAEPYTDLEIPDYDSLLKQSAPRATPLPQGGTLDSLLNALSVGGTITDLVQQARNGQQGGFTEYRGTEATPSIAPNAQTVAGQLATRQRPGMTPPIYPTR